MRSLFIYAGIYAWPNTALTLYSFTQIRTRSYIFIKAESYVDKDKFYLFSLFLIRITLTVLVISKKCEISFSRFRLYKLF